MKALAVWLAANALLALWIYVKTYWPEITSVFSTPKMRRGA